MIEYAEGVDLIHTGNAWPQQEVGERFWILVSGDSREELAEALLNAESFSDVKRSVAEINSRG